MSTAIDDLLARSLEDRRLSRNERQTLAGVVGTLEDASERLAACRRAFELARQVMTDPQAGAVLGWLEDVLKVLGPVAPPPGPAAAEPLAEVHFSPDEDCTRRIARLFA